jgi:hypothetical protein
MFYLEMDVLCSELTPSLIVTEFRINVTDLDYIELGNRLQPTKNVVAINSNFTHKAFDGYDQFISKPKVKRTKKNDGPAKASSGRGRTRPGDHTTFNACIEFTIIIDDEENTKVARYFPRSGAIQIFNANFPIDILINYLFESDLPEFASVSLVGEVKPLLMNYRFSINIGDKKLVNLACLADILVVDDCIKDMAPFPIHYVKYDNDIAKIAIVFTNKIRVHVWPKSGKVNIFGSKAELTGALICEFIRDVFSARWGDLVCDTPIA